MSHKGNSATAEQDQLVVFTLNEQRYAVHLDVVHRVVPMVNVTPLPKSPEVILGLVNVRGEIIPVLSVRRRFALPEREPDLSDQLIIASTARRTVALWVDSVSGVTAQAPDAVVEAEQVAPGSEYFESVAMLEDNILFIHNLDLFLSLDEEQQLRDAMGNN